MTQTYPNTPYAGQYQESREEFQVMGEQLVATVEKLLHEGNVRRIIIKQEGRIILEIPLTIGVVGALVAPVLAAVGAIGAALTNCTIEVGPIHTFMSGTMIDLVSAPIEPGEYQMEINVTMGGVEIFLPRSVQFTLEGSSIAGGRNVHEGPGIWETMKQKLRYIVHLPEQPPDFALAPYNPERPVRIHFVTHIMMGGVDIYRL